MKWLEIIEIRSALNSRHKLEKHLKVLMQEVNNKTGDEVIRIYNQVVVASDISIHLVHASGTIQKDGSKLGLRVAAHLKEFGLVHHNVWIEMQNS